MGADLFLTFAHILLFVIYACVLWFFISIAKLIISLLKALLTYLDRKIEYLDLQIEEKYKNDTDKK